MDIHFLNRLKCPFAWKYPYALYINICSGIAVVVYSRKYPLSVLLKLVLSMFSLFLSSRPWYMHVLPQSIMLNTVNPDRCCVIQVYEMSYHILLWLTVQQQSLCEGEQISVAFCTKAKQNKDKSWFLKQNLHKTLNKYIYCKPDHSGKPRITN